jgi:hypothetical protein
VDQDTSTAAVTAQESVAAAPIAEAAPATETPSSAGQAETPAAVEPSKAETPAAVEPSKAEAVDYRELYEKDHAFKQFVEGRAGDIAKRLVQKLEKQAEKKRLAKAAEDPVEALSYAQERKSAIDAEEMAASKWTAVTEHIINTARDNPDWGKDYEEVLAANRKEADALFAKDPDKFEAWIDEKIYSLRVSREVEKQIKERLPVLVEAAATDRVNKELQNVPRLPDGSGGPGMSDADFLAAYRRGEVHDHKRAREALARL